MDIYQIRKQNLIALIGERKKGACAQKWEMAPAHLSQILSSKTEKNLGDDVARRIETIEGLERGWMDIVHAANHQESAPVAQEEAKTSAAAIVLDMLKKHAAKGMSGTTQEKIAQAVADSLAEKNVMAAPASNVIPADFSRIRPRQGELLVPQYDIRAAMGVGQLPPDYVETVRNLVVNEAHLRAHGVDYTAPENLAMITGWGDSMLGTINDKDPAMIDKGVRDFIGEGIYVLTWHGHLFIKRVQILDGEHYQLISDNPKYPMQKARMDDVIFHAKILLIWNARKA
ncbi:MULTISPECIES: S24 family peptidase [Pseudomonas]|uniref:S24 family peptidase n=1 Tax=Pseudomonas TaxID=286 RepID=UPI0002297179|nr:MULTISPECIES: LexA family transcriptional regulator [Pseudomonas]QGF21353.1 Cro/CI family transcriptional regulator [Pseudomonas phage AUS531phi]AEO74922.1 putative transcriptional regulator [Pseudomonas aeruginosa M18]KSK89398.1 hypothetical protein APA49_24530 [Pseudomonas aeruginosa]MCO7709792.1 phage repressor protein [Pseudomonas aeruginosa]MCO7715633.1 phage repressor protein [Pseudomonas aeruginosa]